MQTVELIQGTPEWHAHRAKHFNASDAPAMMGESKYKTRAELMHELATGIMPDVDAATQKRFDEGHRIEALARPLAEEIAGDMLMPVVGVDGNFSASFDGINIDETYIFEHKTLNNELREASDDPNELPLMYLYQINHQFYVSNADKCIFMATKWDGDTCVEKRHWIVKPNSDLINRLVHHWLQFKKDLEAYTPPVQVEVAEAKDTEQLPVPSVVVRGEVATSNLDEITPKFDNYLAGINTTLETDQHFADAEADAKNCEDIEKRIKALRENIVAQMVDVNAIDTELSKYQTKFNKIKNSLKNAVKNEKDVRRTALILKAKNDYKDHIGSLDKDLQGASVNSLIEAPDFASAIKGKKLISKMQDAIDKALRNAKVSADKWAEYIKDNLEYINAEIDGYEHLFNIPALAIKNHEYTELHINSKIAEEDARIAKAKQDAIEAERTAAIQAKVASLNDYLTKAVVERTSKGVQSLIDRLTNTQITKDEFHELFDEAQATKERVLFTLNAQLDLIKKAETAMPQAPVEEVQTIEPTPILTAVNTVADNAMDLAPDVEDVEAPAFDEMVAVLADFYSAEPETVIKWLKGYMQIQQAA